MSNQNNSSYNIPAWTFDVPTESRSIEVNFSVRIKSQGNNFIVDIGKPTFGLPFGTVLYSTKRNLEWSVQHRLIEMGQVDSTEVYELEQVQPIHINRAGVGIKESENESPEIFEYFLGASHSEAPQKGEKLEIRFPLRICIWRIIEKNDREVVLGNQYGHWSRRKMTVTQNADVGDYVRFCEHNIWDRVDDQGNFVYDRSH